MLRAIIGSAFVLQCLIVATMLGLALKDQREYRTPFGKLFLPYKTQIIVVLWLFASLFANVLFAYHM